jgi:hypothetical protein
MQASIALRSPDGAALQHQETPITYVAVVTAFRIEPSNILGA